MSSRDTAKVGQNLMAQHLRSLGVSELEVKRVGRREYLRFALPSGDQRTAVFVRTTTDQSWQGSLSDGDSDWRPSGVNIFWIFVDPSGPHYFVVPDSHLMRLINEGHESSLARHGGTRPINPESKHAAIRRRDVEHFRGRWDLIGFRGVT